MRTKLKLKRQGKGYSQHDMANILHKNQSTYNRIGTGEFRLYEKDIFELAEIPGCKRRIL